MANRHHENRAAILRCPGGRVDDGKIPIYACFLKIGLVPPFSDFFAEVMKAYGFYLVQIHPNALLVLAAFVHFFERFVGVMPSVALFRHYFTPRVDKKPRIVGGITFRLRDNLSKKYL